MRPMYESHLLRDGPVRLRESLFPPPGPASAAVEEGGLADLCRVEDAQADGRDDQHQSHHPEPSRPGRDVGEGLAWGGEDAPDAELAGSVRSLGRGRRGGRALHSWNRPLVGETATSLVSRRGPVAEDAHNSPSLDDFRAGGVPSARPARLARVSHVPAGRPLGAGVSGA